MAPLGRALLGSSQGDVVVLPGSDESEWRVVSIEILDMVNHH
jgi:transcription elongation GreA/GreB family factor